MLKKFILFFVVTLLFSFNNGEDEEPNCSDPIKTGPCKAGFQRYGYDASKGECVKFTYGGCQGNGNNFKTLEECEANCYNFCE